MTGTPQPLKSGVFRIASQLPCPARVIAAIWSPAMPTGCSLTRYELRLLRHPRRNVKPQDASYSPVTNSNGTLSGGPAANSHSG